jgi:hypothetical protein
MSSYIFKKKKKKKELTQSVSLYDVTTEFTIRRGVILYCDVVLTISMTCRKAYKSDGYLVVIYNIVRNKTKCKYLLV